MRAARDEARGRGQGTLLGAAWGVVRRPRATMAALARDARPGLGLRAMLVAALAFSGLDLWLYAGGHAPSFTGNPIPAADYYLWQALFSPPLLVGCWALYAATARGVGAALGGRGRWARGAAPLGVGYAVALLGGLVAPDLVVYAVGGFDALAPAMRVYAPLCLGWSVWLGTRAVQASEGLTVGRALVVALVAFMTQAVVAATLLR